MTLIHPPVVRMFCAPEGKNHASGLVLYELVGVPLYTNANDKESLVVAEFT
jgi:hypothetical protein